MDDGGDMIGELDLDRFTDDLATLVGYQTVVCRNDGEFARARDWIRQYLAGTDAEFVDFDVDGLTSTIIRPASSAKPTLIGDAHLEVVPGAEPMFALRRDGTRLYGRGAADMKTALLMLLRVMRDLLTSDDHYDLWLVITEDEEVGSQRGARCVVEHLVDRDLLPPVAFVPDGGHDFSYVEREKGIAVIRAVACGDGGHASRPWLAANPIDTMAAFARACSQVFPDPRDERDWRPTFVPTAITAGGASNQIPTECRAVFDLRYTENFTPTDIRARVNDIADTHGVAVQFSKLDAAARYPSDAPIARDYLDLLEDVSGRCPPILHSAGASNGRFYAAHGSHVLMTNARAGGAHSRLEWVDESSLPAYYELVHRTVRLVANRVRSGAPIGATS